MTGPPSDPRLTALLPLMEEAGAALAAASHERVRVEHKGAVDLVTAVDRRLQELLLDGLHARFPGERVIAEEEDAHARPPADQVAWYVDPLDGTTNFVHGYPFYAISVAAWSGDAPLAAAVTAPALGETHVAASGWGSFRRASDGEWHRNPGSDCPRLAEALLATGFPYDRTGPTRLTLACVATALARARGIRRTGSASLDLCYAAAGRLDGFFELTLKPWDVAAGTLIAREAGLVVTDFRGEADVLWAQRICVAPPPIHSDLLRLLADAHAAPEQWPLGPPFPGSVPLTPEDRP